MSSGEQTRGADIVRLYLQDIGTVPLLDAAEEVELAQAIERGVEARGLSDGADLTQEEQARLARDIEAAATAKDRFIRANLRLVVSVAKRYPLPAGMELLDLVQEGNLGLEHAVDKFDWTKGFKFSTYATFWIRQSIGRALDQKASLIRLPGERSAALRAALRHVSGEADELSSENATLHRLATPASLDRTIGDEDGSNGLLDVLASDSPTPEAVAMRGLDRELTTRILASLDGRARTAVELRFGFEDGRNRTYKEVGERLDITAEAARRLVEKSIVAGRLVVKHEYPAEDGTSRANSSVVRAN